jgi:hypothetical protein
MVVAVKIKNPKSSSSKASRVTGLAQYIKAPQNANASEKCIHFGARNFLSKNFQSQLSEMVALATDCVKSKDPIRHDVISLKEHEVPTQAQVEEIIDLYLQEMGLVGHQVFYGLHADTDDMHIHVQVNRVHPETYKAIKTDRGFDKEALQRLCARIEHAQGWQAEPNSRYTVQPDGSMNERPYRGDIKGPRSHVKNMELRTGIKRAERIVIEDATPILLAANHWSDLHTSLAAVGIRYERHGSGALLWVGGVQVKASVVARDARFAALQKRLGPFEASGPQERDTPVGNGIPSETESVRGEPNQNVPKDRSREPLCPKQESGGWSAYSIARAEHYKSRRLDTDDLRKRHVREREALKSAQKRDREESIQQGEHRAGLTNTLRKLLAFEHTKAKLDLKDKHAGERAALKARYAQFAASYEEWLRARGQNANAEKWRYRENPNGQQCKIHGVGTPQPARIDIRNFRATVDGWKVRYLPIEGDGDGFIDKGNIVLILGHDDGTVLAALQLAAQKWPDGFEVSGSEDFLNQCCRLAAEHGLTIANPELQSQIEVERQKIQIACDAAKQLAGQLQREIMGEWERPQEREYPRERPC